MKKLILIVLIMLAIILSTTAVIVTQTKQDEAVLKQQLGQQDCIEQLSRMYMENAKTTAEKFILDRYSENVKLTTQTMKDTTGKGRIAFMIEAEGNTDSIHNLFIVEVKRDKAELIAQLF